MKISDLKLMIYFETKKEVVLKSITNDDFQDMIYNDWDSFVFDETVDDLILDYDCFGVVVRSNVIVLVVV